MCCRGCRCVAPFWVPVLMLTPLMGAKTTSRSVTVWRWKQDCFWLACSSCAGPASISRLVLVLLDTMSMGGSRLWRAREMSVSSPSEVHPVCLRTLSWSCLNSPMTLDTRSRVSYINMLVVEHGWMFAKGVAEDLWLYCRPFCGKTCSACSSWLSCHCWLHGASQVVSQAGIAETQMKNAHRSRWWQTCGP